MTGPVRATDGGPDVANAQEGSLVVTGTLRVGPRTVAAGGPGDVVPIVPHPFPFRKAQGAHHADDDETWVEADVSRTLLGDWSGSEVRATELAVGGDVEDDPRLPPGLDGHRYRAAGNGVVAPNAEWLGRRVAAEMGG